MVRYLTLRVLLQLTYLRITISAEGEAKPEGDKIVENDEQELAAGTYEFNVYDITEGEELLGTVTHEAATSGRLGAAIQFPTIKAVVKPTATDDELGMKVVTGNMAM